MKRIRRQIVPTGRTIAFPSREPILVALLFFLASFVLIPSLVGAADLSGPDLSCMREFPNAGTLAQAEKLFPAFEKGLLMRVGTTGIEIGCKE